MSIRKGGGEKVKMGGGRLPNWGGGSNLMGDPKFEGGATKNWDPPPLSQSLAYLCGFVTVHQDFLWGEMGVRRGVFGGGRGGIWGNLGEFGGFLYGSGGAGPQKPKM